MHLVYRYGVIAVWLHHSPFAGIHGRLALLACGKEGVKCRGQTVWLTAVA
jgi:hypothetical protein